MSTDIVLWEDSLICGGSASRLAAFNSAIVSGVLALIDPV